VLNVNMLFEMRAERNSCARNITLGWIYAFYFDFSRKLFLHCIEPEIDIFCRE